MCELSELCELSPQDAVESLSVKGVMGGVGLFFEETQGLVGLSRPGAACSTICKIRYFWVLFEVWRLSGGWCQISSLFHEDDQDAQDDQIN